MKTTSKYWLLEENYELLSNNGRDFLYRFLYIIILTTIEWSVAAIEIACSIVIKDVHHDNYKNEHQSWTLNRGPSVALNLQESPKL